MSEQAMPTTPTFAEVEPPASPSAAPPSGGSSGRNSPDLLPVPPQDGMPRKNGSSSSISSFFRKNKSSGSLNSEQPKTKFSIKMVNAGSSEKVDRSFLLSPRHSASSRDSSMSEANKSSSSSRTSVPKDSPSSKKKGLELKRFFKNVVKPPSKVSADIHEMQNRLHKGHRHHRISDFIKSNLSSSSLKEQPESVVMRPAQSQGAESSTELINKYGIPGKLLGEGAGGSVSIVQRPSDGRFFAVKSFKAKSERESNYDYRKKIQKEFFVGSTLHNPHIIETYDMLQEGDLFLVVMEYAPYDFFTIVMSGLLQKQEIFCYFKQIVAGVNYLHSVGLAHRDLKLDNCVVSSDGILKLIDFGSAAVFQYPFEEQIIKATGVVGSDPYLAPEVLEMQSYDPRPADVWSIAIIYCCMVLVRFPWKAPKSNDPSFKAFAATSEDGTATPTEKSRSQGPYRLLRLLPTASRDLIGKMLTIDPLKRITMPEVMGSEWVRGIQNCHYEEEQLVKATDHTHHLVTEEDVEKIQEERKREREIAREL